MRILFVSGTSVGGAARSTHELAALLAHRGHAVTVLARREDAPRRTEIHRRAVNLRVKLGRGAPARLADRAARTLGRRARTEAAHRPYPSLLAIRPENALRDVSRRARPEVVIVNSIDLPAWRQVRDDLRHDRVPLVLYVREETGLLHVSHSKAPPDLLFANAEGHVAAAAALGFEAEMVPSVVDCEPCLVESTRERVLFVNPIPMQGLDIALALAEALPDVPFAFAESWPLGPRELADLEQRTGSLPNVEIRRFTADPRELFRDARVVLAPYRYPGRSRVIAEAQCNGIPALASDRYGPAEAVGPGGILCDPDGAMEPWVEALSILWNDESEYERLARAAREHSRREDMRHDVIAARVEQALTSLVRDTSDRRGA